MIDNRIFKEGATSITIEVAEWDSKKTKPTKFRCVITQEGRSGPNAFTATRDSELAAERECVESFLKYFTGKKHSVHPGTRSLRKSSVIDTTDDDYEY